MCRLLYSNVLQMNIIAQLGQIRLKHLKKVQEIVYR